MEVCPDTKFQNFVRGEFTTLRSCLSRKISWTMTGVIVAICTAAAFLTYEAYSGEQKRQCEEVVKNSTEVQVLKTNVRVMQVEFSHVKDGLLDLKKVQREQFDAIMKKLENLNDKKGGDRE